jgi:ComF family protein
MWIKLKTFLLDVFFPKSCLNCGREGDYLCQDCQGMLALSGFHEKPSVPHLEDLYFPLSYQNPLFKTLLHQFKYEPFLRELSRTLTDLIIAHFQLLDNQIKLQDAVLLAVPLHKKRLKWRGFNQAEEIARELSRFLNIPLLQGCLSRTKETRPQVELNEEERKENVKGIFEVTNKELLKDKKILLVDDVCTTGTTLSECAKALREAGAREVIGVTLARG